VRLRPERPNHVWSYDFVQDRTADGRVYRTLNIIDEYTREALMIRVDRKLNSTDVLDALTDLFILRGPPEYIRSDNGPEFIAQKVRDWIAAVGAKTAYIEPGSPWENGYCESFNARFRTNCSTAKSSTACGSPNPDRAMARPLQHGQAAQRIGLPPACARKHRANGPEAHDALTIKPDHPMGADQVLLLVRDRPLVHGEIFSGAGGR
jgi:putative transposase